MTAPLPAAAFLTHLNALEFAAYTNAHGDVRKAWEAVNRDRADGHRHYIETRTDDEIEAEWRAFNPETRAERHADYRYEMGAGK